MKCNPSFMSTEGGAIRGAERSVGDASEQGGDEPGQRSNSLVYVGPSPSGSVCGFGERRANLVSSYGNPPKPGAVREIEAAWTNKETCAMRTFSSIYAFNASRYGLRAATCITNGAQGGDSGEDMLGQRKQAAKLRSPEEFKEDNQTRIRRVDRWIDDCQDPRNRDAHTQFIFYWIAFDAMVSDNVNFTQDKMLQFLGRIVQLDNKETVSRALMDCQEEIRKILKLRYTMQTFWTELSYSRKKTGQDKPFQETGLGEFEDAGEGYG